MIGSLTFLSPWLLLGLLALPLLWLLLRAVPPAPTRRRFPGVVLLLGLKDSDAVSARTPWWLLLLRTLAMALVILGLAEPVLNPQKAPQDANNTPLLIVLDGSWASARSHAEQEIHLRVLLENAGRQARPIGILQLTNPEPVNFRGAESWKPLLPMFTPLPWEAPDQNWSDILGDSRFDTVWLSDGLARDSRKGLLNLLQKRGHVEVHESTQPLIVLNPVQVQGGVLNLHVRRLAPGPQIDIQLNGIGTDPAGIVRTLITEEMTLSEGVREAQLELSLPAELRARIQRFEVAGQNHAGAVSLSAENLHRKEIALIAGRARDEGLELLSPLHYLERALKPSADLLYGGVQDILPANPDTIILADVTQLASADKETLLEWVQSGGSLVRFAGPRLAASDISRGQEDPLLPVRLRAGGRTVGGTMSWGEPRHLAPFDQQSPFYGLRIPDDVTVNAQVLAQPDPDLANRVIARLEDGTPLVTRKPVGSGQIVLFHITANAEWSNLPLSGLFVQMLERLSVASAKTFDTSDDLTGTSWQPVATLDAFGNLSKATGLAGVDGVKILTDPLGPDLPPGTYQSDEQLLARNVITAETKLTPATWPAGVLVRTLSKQREVFLGG